MRDLTLAASVASSISLARQGTLHLLVGRDAAVFARMEPLLRELSASLRRGGPVGNAAGAQYRKMIDFGLGDLDKSSIAELTFPDRARH
ncbi:MAG: hypothetical protein WCJ14_10415 [Verrucomicrobiota bacterium]